MCQYRSPGGTPNDWHLAHLGRFALGGAGIVFFEETAVEARGRKTYDCMGIWADEQITAFARVNDFLRSAGCVPAVQLGHSGAKASTRRVSGKWQALTEADSKEGKPPWQPLSSSPVVLDQSHALPKQMDHDDIRAVVTSWGEAARRSLDAGFDIVEIHGAHGYLLHQFLSPVTNRRQDGYGGDRSGRMRIAIEVAESVRRVWPEDKPLFFRISTVDGKGGLWSLADSVALALELKQRGVDVIDCSSGGISGSSPMPVVPWTPGHHVPYASRIKSETGLMTVAVGMITEARQAEKILQSGSADIIALGRELLLHSDWPIRAAEELGFDAYSLLPDTYAFRLRRREKARSHPLNRMGAPIPVSPEETMGAG